MRGQIVVDQPARGSINALNVNGKIHLIGGATLPPGIKDAYIHPSRNTSVTTHEVYDIASNGYSKRADMPTARNHSASGVINGKIYIVGGRTGSVFIPNAFNVDLVDEYDPATDQWSLKSPMPTIRSFSAIRSASVRWGFQASIKRTIRI